MNFPHEKLGTQLRISVHGPLEASLSQHSLAWHDFDLAFRNFGPSPLEWLLSPSMRPPTPPSPRRLWPGQAGQGLTSPSCLPSPSPEGPQSMVNFSGDFLGDICGASQQVFWDTPKKPCTRSVQTSV